MVKLHGPIEHRQALDEWSDDFRHASLSNDNTRPSLTADSGFLNQIGAKSQTPYLEHRKKL